MRIAILAILLAACGDPMPEPTPDATPAPLCSSIPGCDAAHLTCTGTRAEQAGGVLAVLERALRPVVAVPLRDRWIPGER